MKTYVLEFDQTYLRNRSGQTRGVGVAPIAPETFLPGNTARGIVPILPTAQLLVRLCLPIAACTYTTPLTTFSTAFQPDPEDIFFSPSAQQRQMLISL
jgi:hypothetical protein